MRACIFAGSFDPITNGHIDVITRATALFDKVYVAVGVNERKTPFIPENERVALIKSALSGMPSVEVISYKGLTVDLCKKLNCYTLVRGVRSLNDFVYEKEMEDVNKALCDKTETVYLTSSEKVNFVSSSVVRELFDFNGDYSSFVPENVAKYLDEKKNERN